MSRSNPINALERCKRFLSRKKNSFTGKYHLYTGEKLNWFQVTLRLEMSLIPVILPWVIFGGVYGFLISLVYHFGFPIGFSHRSGVLTNAVLTFNIGFTLLLVFRTNTANERFWEGRQLWGALVNTVRNLAQGIYVVVKEQSPKDKVKKEATIRLLVAFAIAMKLHLRAESLDAQLASLMSETQYFKLKDTQHPPLQIAFWIRDYLQHQHDRNSLNIYQLTALHNLVDDLVDILGGCERILRTPLPLIYTIKLRQLLLIFCLILPLEIVSYLTWWTGIITAFVSFTLLSIEQIGSEIEEPFGHDPNDLPLDVICNTMLRNVEELIKVAPSTDYDLQL
ncbi:bestrophin family protein [Mastigocladopsis repens]|uniref:bestrophin family protein n=1 Tax=Mastigocladopsis repens TaxID=221287 RepID=UPI0002F7E046|nr:bestrophin family ion channel [Mastigocladopsis repens]